MTLSMLLANTPQPTPSETIMLWTLILTSVGSFVTAIIALVKGQMDRWQDREDAKAKAALLLAEGAAREQRINAKIDANTRISEAALEVSNGHNQKIKSALETVADLTETVKAAVEKK